MMTNTHNSLIKYSGILLPTCVAMILFMSTGCQKGPAERAGARVDNAVEEVKDTAEEVGENIEDTVERIQAPKGTSNTPN